MLYLCQLYGNKVQLHSKALQMDNAMVSCTLMRKKKKESLQLLTFAFFFFLFAFGETLSLSQHYITEDTGYA